jgi:hypothetical protein
VGAVLAAGLILAACLAFWLIGPGRAGVLELDPSSAARPGVAGVTAEAIRIEPGWTCRDVGGAAYTEFTGTVTNTSAETLRYIRLRVTLSGADGTIGVSNTGYAAADAVPPGGSAPFRIFVENGGRATADCDVAVDAAYAAR